MTDIVALRGLAPLNLTADDVAAARDWYTAVLGVEPYFQMPDAEAPQYVEFRLGDLHTSSVLDPFGNVIGLIQSPHYLEMLAGG